MTLAPRLSVTALILATALAWASPVSAENASPGAPTAELHRSPEVLRSLLPDHTRMLVKVSPERMRAATRRLARWLPAEITMYQRNRHPEARLAAALMTDRPGHEFFDDYTNERLPDFSDHLENAPVFLAISIPRSETLLKHARFGAPLLDPARRPTSVHYRLLIPSKRPTKLVDALDAYCEPDPELRRLGSCETKIGARTESGYFVLDTAGKLSGQSPPASSLRSRLGYDASDSDKEPPRDTVLPNRDETPDSKPPPSNGDRANEWFDRRTPAFTRFLTSHRAFEFYARTDQLWALTATQKGVNSPFSRATISAANTLIVSNPGGREIEDIHFRAGLGPGTTVRLSVTGTLTNLGKQLLEGADTTPELPSPQIEGANVSIQWDSGSLLSLAGIDIPSWLREPAEIRSLFPNDTGHKEFRRDPFSPESGTHESRLRSRVSPGDFQLLALSQPHAVSAISRRAVGRHGGFSELSQLSRRTDVIPLAGRASARFHWKPEAHDSPLRRFGLSVVSPSAPSDKQKTRLLREFGYEFDLKPELRVSGAGSLKRLDFAGNVSMNDTFRQRATDKREDDRRSRLSALTVDVDFDSMAGHLLDDQEINYRSRPWHRMARLSEFHLRAGQTRHEIAGVATFGALPDDAQLQISTPVEAGRTSFSPATPPETSATKCRRTWLKNLTVAARQGWLHQPGGLDRVAQVTTECARGEPLARRIDDAIEEWSAILAKETLSVGRFRSAAHYARHYCRKNRGYVCTGLTELTQLAETLQLPAPSAKTAKTLRRFGKAAKLDLRGPLPTVVTLSAEGAFVGNRRLLTPKQIKKSHLKPDLHEQFRSGLMTYLRRHLDRFTDRRVRAGLPLRESDTQTPIHLAADRRAPSGEVIKFLQMIPESNQLEPFAQFRGRWLVRGTGGTAGDATVDLAKNVQSASQLRDNTLYVSLGADGVEIMTSDGKLFESSGCPRDNASSCEGSPDAIRMNFFKIRHPAFGPDFESLDSQTTQHLNRRFEEYPGFASEDRAVTTMVIDQTARQLGFKAATSALADWLNKKVENLEEPSYGYGSSGVIDRIIIFPGPDVPWGLTVRLLTRIEQLRFRIADAMSETTFYLARPNLRWAPQKDESDDKEGGQ